MLSENVMKFLPKTLPYLFEIQERLETCQYLNLRDFRRPSFGDYITLDNIFVHVRYTL